MTQRKKKDMPSTVFIIDIYNKYHKNDNVRYTFPVNGTWYCIREVPLEWGLPEFPEKDWNDDYTQFQLYSTYEDALTFARAIQKIGEQQL